MEKERFLWNCFPSSKNNILEFNQYVKSDKMPYIIYSDIESLIKKVDNWKSNPEKNRKTYSIWIFNINNDGI